jgi:hypothetical protein
MPAVDTMESTTSAAPLIPPVYDVAFTALWLLILAVTVVAIVVVAFSRQTATTKLLLIALTIVAPLLGGLASLIIVGRDRKKHFQRTPVD